MFVHHNFSKNFWSGFSALAMFVALPQELGAVEKKSELTLQQAIGATLSHSKELQSAILRLENQAQNPAALDGALAWSTYAEIGVNQDAAPRTNPFQPETITTVPMTAGVQKLFSSGTSIDASVSLSYFDAPFPSQGGGPIFSAIERGYTQNATVRLQHPLWGNSPGRLLKLQREVAEQQRGADALQVAVDLDNMFANVTRLFSKCVLAGESVQTARAAKKFADEVLVWTRRNRPSRHRRSAR